MPSSTVGAVGGHAAAAPPAGSLARLLPMLGGEVEDTDEEVALVFSQNIPSQDLGFVDSHVETLDVAVGEQTLSIHQSPAVLKSNLKGGTTGAVVWRVTPRFASWLATRDNILFSTGCLTANSTVVELGSGISGVVALTLAPRITKYLATDQQYALRLLAKNVAENYAASFPRPARSGRKGTLGKAAQPVMEKIGIAQLDWEEDSVSNLKTHVEVVDVVIACDCIYNESLVQPFVETCADICRQFQPQTPQQTICLIAQQLRSPDVFEVWLEQFRKQFRVWRVPDEHLSAELQEGHGYVVHLGILRTPPAQS